MHSDRTRLADGRPNGAAFFVVTNVEYDILANGDVASVPDMYTGAMIGELGCWMDPSTTRLVQAGVEHSRVPDVSDYFGLGKLRLNLHF